MTRAIVFVPGDEFDPHAARCVAYAEDQGYDLIGIIRDNWPAAQKMLGDGETSVVIVSEQAHLDPARKPRVEVVADQYHSGTSGWEQRTRVIRRIWGA